MENWLCSGESQHKKLLEDLHLVQFATLKKEHAIVYKQSDMQSKF